MPTGPTHRRRARAPGRPSSWCSRVAHLIESSQARRDQIALLTFSRRAAGDIRRRVDAALSWRRDADRRLHLPLARSQTPGGGDGANGPSPSPRPSRSGWSVSSSETEDPEHWPMIYRGILGTPAFAGEVADFLMRCSERMLSPEDLEARATERADWKGIPGLFRRYRETLEELGRTDYAHSPRLSRRAPRTAPRVRTWRRSSLCAGRRVSGHFARPGRDRPSLALPHGNLTVAGDPYQSIYSFRGAEVRNIAAFADQHPEARRDRPGQEPEGPGPDPRLGAAHRLVRGPPRVGRAGRARRPQRTGRDVRLRPGDRRGRLDRAWTSSIRSGSKGGSHRPSPCWSARNGRCSTS